MIEGGKEEKDTLNNEIESWKKAFEYALSCQLLFNKMLTECQDNEEEYGKAASAAIGE